MKYFEIFPCDRHSNLWILGEESLSGHQLFECYSKMVCPNCGKVDERSAISMGCDPRVRVESRKDAKRDILQSDDGFFLFSVNFVEKFKSSGCKGVTFLHLPGDDRFQVAIPLRVPIDLAIAGLKYHPPFGSRPYGDDSTLPEEDADHRCILCGRFFEMTSQPLLSSIRLPTDPLMVFAPDFRYEKQEGEVGMLFVSGEVRQLLTRWKVKGIEFEEAY